MNVAGPPESHLALRRVDVDIDALCGQVDIERHDRKPARGEHRPVNLGDRVRYHAVPDGTAVDENSLARAVGARVAGAADQTLDTHPLPLVTGFEQRKVGTQKPPHTIPPARGSGRRQKLAPIGHEREPTAWMRQSKRGNRLCHESGLSLFRAEELPPGWRIEKQRVHLHYGSPARRDLLHPFNRPSPQLQSPARSVESTARQAHHGDRRDRGQGLSAEAQGADRFQLLGRGKLARRVPLDGKEEILSIHPLPVVRDPNEGPPPCFQLRCYCLGTGVEAVFGQFLENRSRALDDFSRSDPVRQDLRKDDDFPHRAPRKRRPGLKSGQPHCHSDMVFCAKSN